MKTLLTLAFAVSLSSLFAQGLDYEKYKESQKPGLKSDGLEKAKEDLDRTIRENNWKMESWGSDHDHGGDHDNGGGAASEAERAKEPIEVERYMREVNDLTREYMKSIEAVEGTLDEAVGPLPVDDISSDPVVKACERTLGIAVEQAFGLALSVAMEDPTTLVEKAMRMVIDDVPCKLAKESLEEAIAQRCESAVREIRGNRSISPQEQERIDELVGARAAEMADRRMRVAQAAQARVMQRREEERQEASKGAAIKASPAMNSNCKSRVPVAVTRAPDFN